MKQNEVNRNVRSGGTLREEFPTGNKFLDKWGPRFVSRATEFVTATLLALPVNIGFLVYLFFSDTILLWSVVSGAAVVTVSVLFMMAICEIIRNIYLNVQDEKRAERDRRREEEARRRAEEAEAAKKQREMAEAARIAAITEEASDEQEQESQAEADTAAGGNELVTDLPELQTPALCDAVLTSLSDAGVVLTRADLLQLLAAMQASRVIRFSGLSYHDMSRTAQALSAAFGNENVKYGSDTVLPLFQRPDILDSSAATLKIIPLDGTGNDTINRFLLAERDKIRMPFVDEADRKKEFLPDMAQDNWIDCRIWYFLLMPDAYTSAALDDWSVTVTVLPTVDAGEKTAAPVASAASLQVLSGRAPEQGAGEAFCEAVDALDDFLLTSLHKVPSNPLVRTAERFVAAALAAGFTAAEAADRFLSGVRLPAVLRAKEGLTQDELTSLGEKINALFGYDNVPLSRKLLSDAPHTAKVAQSDNV